MQRTASTSPPLGGPHRGPHRDPHHWPRRALCSAGLGALVGLLASSCTAPTTPHAGAADATTPSTADPQVAALATRLAREAEPTARAQAAGALGALGRRAQAQVGALAAALDDPELQVKVAAAGALARLASAHVSLGAGLEALQAAVHDEATAVRVAALGALAQAHRDLDRAAAEAPAIQASLYQALADADSAVRAAAADGLGVLLVGHLPRAGSGAPTAVPRASPTEGPAFEPERLTEVVAALGRLLDDPTAEVRAAGARALGRAGLAAGHLRSAVRARANDTDAAVRLWARHALSRLDPHDPAALSLLVHALQLGGAESLLVQGLAGGFGSGGVAQVVAGVLGGDRQAWTALAESTLSAGLGAALPGHEDEVRWLALYSLSLAQGDLRPLVPALMGLLTDPHAPLRVQTVALLSRVIETAPAVLPQVVNPLRAALTDAAIEVRVATARALEGLARVDAPTRAALVSAADDAAEAVRVAATATLARVAATGGTLASELGPVLRRKGTDAAEAVRAVALEGIAGLLRGEVALPAVDLAATTDALHAALREGSAAVRAGTLQGLASLPDRARLMVFADSVQAALSDEDGAVRIAAARALGRLGSLGADAGDRIGALAERLRDDLPAVRVAALEALAAYGDRAAAAVPAMLAALASGAEGVREAAILALAALGDAARSAIPPLRALAVGDSRLARVAREALDRLDR